MAGSPVWSRFVRFAAHDGRELCGEPEDADIDVGLDLQAGKPVSVKVLNGTTALDRDMVFTGETVTIKDLLTPISAHECGTIRCIGMNYRDHVKEMKGELPKVPEVFMKAPTCVLDPSKAIVLPRAAGDAVDGECELAVVIREDCKDVSEASAMDYILGYTLGNDVTARDVQAGILQWGYAKGFDGFCPLGPTLVSAQAMPDPFNLLMKTTVNGKILQDSSTSEMIFTIPQIVSYVSRGTTLPRGSIILTGTPAGIGHSHDPPLYLREGSDVRVTIGGGIGTLTNKVVAEC